MIVFLRLLLIILPLIGDKTMTVNGEYTIPEFLLECYRSSTPLYPLTMSNFIDIIRKLELLPGVTYDAASLSSLLVHRFTLDGIERDPNISPSYQFGIIPFKLSGSQKYRDSILKQSLLPADYFYPPNALTHVEKCSLHFMLSSSVDQWERGDEYIVCPKLKQQKQWYTDEQYGTKMSSCPIEMGVIYSRDEAISPNRIISAVLAALMPTYMQVESGNTAEPQRPLSSLWASTLAGDLATVVIFQNEHNHTIGSSGYWNDTAIPTNYYLMDSYGTVANKKWQLTKSQLLADIDGLIMALEIERNKNLRLSQLIETFYSTQSRCRRKLFFTENIQPRIQQLYHQTMLFSKLLRSQCPVCYYQNDTALSSNLNQAILKLQSNADNYLQVGCSERQHWPNVQLNIIFDSTYLPYSKLQFFMKVAEMLDISYYGSRMTIINGETGAVIVNDATNTGQVYTAWRNTTHYDRDVKYLDLSKSFISLDSVLRNNEKRIRTDEANIYSHVTLVIGLSSTLQNRDLQSLTSVIKTFIYTHPEQRLIYLSTPLTRNVFDTIGGYHRDGTRNQVIDLHKNQPVDPLIKHILAGNGLVISPPSLINSI